VTRIVPGIAIDYVGLQTCLEMRPGGSLWFGAFNSAAQQPAPKSALTISKSVARSLYFRNGVSSLSSFLQCEPAPARALEQRSVGPVARAVGDRRIKGL
jgi:hypothetical protein